MGYTIAELDDERHRSDIISLLLDNLPVGTREAMEKRYDWFYGDNPAGPPTTTLVTADGEVVGCGSSCPRVVRVPGVAPPRMRAGMLCDFAVNKAHRAAQAALMIQRAVSRESLANGATFLFGCPNGAARAVFERMGYLHIGDTVSYAKPLRVRALLERRGAPRQLAAIGAPAADLLIEASDVLRNMPALLQYDAEVVGRADAAFDELWGRATIRHITGEKTSRFLNWRYSGLCSQRFSILRVVERATGSLFGYAVFGEGGDVATIVDLFAEDLSGVDVVLFHLGRELGRRGCPSMRLSYFGCDALAGHLQRAGFRLRPESRSVYLHLPPDAEPALARLLVDRQRWLMVDGELDI